MAWNGTGTFSRTNGTNTGATLWNADKVAGTKITSSRHDTHDQDLSDGVNACLTHNNEKKPTAHFLPNADANYNLGSSGKKWVDLHLSGILYIGGNQASLPSGTDMLFYQTAAPTGWTKNTTASLNDHALRIMTSGSWTSGTQGTTAFSTQFAQSFAGENYTLLTADMPAHTHSIASRSNNSSANDFLEDADSTETVRTMATGSTGGDGAHKHDVNLGVKYLDMIIASKD